ncbi:50S ribosomal protein L24e [archaeon SCG-AAA382B04]|nr:50S ribosomal protein L24e [archaeon SCG-AAA382B04]
MVQERECSFCNEKIPPGKGKMYVKTTGEIFYFCSSKCQKNMLDLKRKKRDVEWVEGE